MQDGADLTSSDNSEGKDQPGKVANPARGQLNRKNEHLHVRDRP